jgi:hypothetical protein
MFDRNRGAGRADFRVNGIAMIAAMIAAGVAIAALGWIVQGVADRREH